MKKAIVLLLLAALSLGLYACSAMGSVSSMSVNGINAIGNNGQGNKPALDLFGSSEDQQQEQADVIVPENTELYVPGYSEPVVITPPTQTTRPTQPVTSTLEYWVENCDYLFMSESDLYGLTKEECRIARNAIYAKSGRIFQATDLSNYFSQYSWYYPRVRPENFSDSMLNSAQLHNLNVVIEYESRWDY